MNDLITIREDEGIVRLTINRPDAMNALTQAADVLLIETLNKYGNNPDVRVIVIEGAGDKAFCAGSDLKERKSMTPAERWHQTQMLQKVLFKIEEIPVPVIAAIKGYCLGGGLELALACDIRIAASSATFGFPEMTLGAFPGSGGPIRMTRLISPAAAKEFLMTARKMKADEASRIGLISRLVEVEKFDEAVADLCQEIRKSTRRGIAAVKKLINSIPDQSLESSFALSAALREPMDGTADYEEGIKAHYEKRTANFK